MLKLNFIKTGEKKGKPVYEFDNFEFHPIRESKNNIDLQMDLFSPSYAQTEPKKAYLEEYKRTLLNMANKIIGKK